MALSRIYADRVRDELKGAVDTRKLAETWAALSPPGTPAAPKAALDAFTARARDPIEQAYKRVLPKALTEGWVLGQQAAKAMAGAPGTTLPRGRGSSLLAPRPAGPDQRDHARTPPAHGHATSKQLAKADVEADFPPVDWAGWEPGDYDAALNVADGGLQWLLNQQGITIKSIASSRVDELGNVLAEYISAESASRPPLPADLPPEYSVGALADALEGVLDNPERAMMVAHTEIARASSAATMSVFQQLKVARAEVSTAGDKRVCPKCAAAELAGPQPLQLVAKVPLHPLCRCALIPVLPALPKPGAAPGAVGDLGEAEAADLGEAEELGAADEAEPLDLDGYEADQWIEDNTPDLTEAQARAVADYTEYAFGANSALRAGSELSAESAAMMRALDSAMSPLAVALVLTRIVGADVFPGITSLPGSVITEQAYSSTSLGGYGYDDVRMTITAPAGTPAIVTGDYSVQPEQREIILARGTQLLVETVTDLGNGRWELVARVVSQAAKASRTVVPQKMPGKKKSTLADRMADAVYTVVSG